MNLHTNIYRWCKIRCSRHRTFFECPRIRKLRYRPRNQHYVHASWTAGVYSLYSCVYTHVYMYTWKLHHRSRAINWGFIYYMHVFMCVCEYVCMFMFLDMYVYIYIHTLIHVCIYIYIYIYTHTHTHTHIYIYIYIRIGYATAQEKSHSCFVYDWNVSRYAFLL
jgi:hypothetical protein